MTAVFDVLVPPFGMPVTVLLGAGLILLCTFVGAAALALAEYLWSVVWKLFAS